MVAVAAAQVIGAGVAGGGEVTAAANPTSIVLDGHGYGHGVGLSQYGALGYAVNFGWSSGQILDHFYAGTVAAVAQDSEMSIRLSGFDGASQTAVVHDKGLLAVDGIAGANWRSVVARETREGHYSVWGRTDVGVCPSAAVDLTNPAEGWSLLSADLSSVVIRPQDGVASSANIGDLLGACETATGRVRYYRGFLQMLNSSSGANRTVSHLPVEQYIRSVVAGEVSWGWAALGGGQGAQALQAQAVAARSYGLAEHREPYAKTCDNICQTYRGAAYRTGVAGALVAQEFPATDAAVAATAGVVRRYGSAGGAIAYTMYSSSSGGFTAATSLGFTPVPDEGDAVAGNGAHTWTATLSASTIESAFPTIGTFANITIVSREGNGEWGGRVLMMSVNGSAASVTTTGSTFRSKLGLKSSWFIDRGTVGGEGSGGGAPVPVPAPTDSCNGRVTTSLAGAGANSASSTFTALSPIRLIDTRIGLGTEQRPIGAGCTLEVDPHLPDDATAVVINVTAVDPVFNGFLTAYPCGADRPLASIVPAIANRVVPGTAIVPLNRDGLFCVYSMASTDIVIDLSGVYRTDTGDRFQPVLTQRRFDSRGGPLVEGGTVVRVPIAGVAGVPATARAVAVTVHASDSKFNSFITVWPCDPQRPTTSVLNTSPGAAVSNHVQVGLDASGALCMFAQHSLHLVVDVSGWFGPEASASYHALMPSRILDSRDGTGLAGIFAAGQNRPLTVVGVGGVPSSAVTAIAAEVTSTDAKKAGFITVHPCLAAVPGVSMVRNFPDTVAATTVAAGIDAAGRWCLQPNVAMHVVVDITGYYG